MGLTFSLDQPTLGYRLVAARFWGRLGVATVEVGFTKKIDRLATRLLKVGMKIRPFLLIPSLSLLSSCVTHPDVIVVQPPFQKQPIKIVGCKAVVQYSANSFSFKGFDVPVPQLGGNVKVGEFAYKPQTLNTLYRNVAILDGLRLGYCGDRVVAAQTSLAAFQACNERIQQQEEKIAYLAMSATQGEAAVEEAVHKYGTASSSGKASTPANADAKKVDNAAAAGVKQKAKAAAASAVPNASPAPSAVSPPLPAQVAAVVQNVPARTLIKMARQPAPSPVPMPH